MRLKSRGLDKYLVVTSIWKTGGMKKEGNKVEACISQSLTKATEAKGLTDRRVSERTKFKKAGTNAGKTNGSGLKIIIGSGKKN